MKKTAMFNDSVCMDDARRMEGKKSQAVSLARMLSFALEEAKEIGATDCQILISQGIRDLHTRYRLNTDELYTTRVN